MYCEFVKPFLYKKSKNIQKSKMVNFIHTHGAYLTKTNS
jgi:hypothetical protein